MADRNLRTGCQTDTHVDPFGRRAHDTHPDAHPLVVAQEEQALHAVKLVEAPADRAAVQPALGFFVAMYNDYDVKAFGFLDISALGESNPALRSLFFDLHTWMAVLLIVLVLLHGADRLKKLFT